MLDRETIKKDREIKSLKSLNSKLIIENEQFKQTMLELEEKVNNIENTSSKELREEMLNTIHEYKKLCQEVKDLRVKYEDNLKDIKLVKKQFIKAVEKNIK